jgi:putative ABC transport system permease protein
MLAQALKLAFASIWRNALRSFLTGLGIIIGVGAVIAMVTLGRGATARVRAELGRLGSNLLVVAPGQFGPGRPSSDARPFDARDLEAMRTQLRAVRAVAPVSQRSATAVYGSESRVTTVTGTDGDYLITQDWDLAAGRSFLDAELRTGRAVCIVGQTVRETLFGFADPIGERLRLKNVSCEVIGVLAAKGAGGMGADQDDTVLVPIRAYQRRIAGNADIGRIHVSALDGADTAKLQADLERLLRERRSVLPGEEDDFTVRDLEQIVEATVTTTALLTGLLGAVAAVSLLVGGIGIMNIMLVSVTERTREIGIRLAIGALESQVLLQFLVEAVVLSVGGGLLGIAFGLALAAAIAQALGVPFLIDPQVIALAFGFSGLVGVVFGFMPARRAARLDPIDALRRE